MAESVFERRRRMMREIEEGATQGTRDKSKGAEDLVGKKEKDNKVDGVNIREYGQED